MRKTEIFIGRTVSNRVILTKFLMHRERQICRGSRATFFFSGIFLLMFMVTGSAVILYRTGDPTANTTEPVGALAGSGWQYEGQFGAFLGTTISPHHFITAKHLGRVSDKFLFRG